MRIRKFKKKDAASVSDMIARTLRETNSRDYPEAYIEEAVQTHKEAVILDRAKQAHMYVACEDDKVVGCGAIDAFWGSETESILLTIFVLPQHQGKGIGKAIIQTLESDPFFKRAARVEIPASVTAYGFYLKMGYVYKNKNPIPDADGCIRMEKIRKEKR